MNPQRFDRFSQPQFLHHIGRERVTALLLPFAEELLGHGILLPARTLPDEAFFIVLATLPRQQAQLSPALLEAMTAIEVIEEVYPDERAAAVELTELRLRVRTKGRAIVLKPSASREEPGRGTGGYIDCWIEGLPAPQGAADSPGEPITVNVAQAAFALLVKLDAQGKHKAPTPLTVFRLYCMEGHSAARVARKCTCSKGTVMSRLRFIETETKTRPEQFRAMSGHLQQMDDEYNASGAREIYRRGLAQESDE
jgi:hypothetical protein